MSRKEGEIDSIFSGLFAKDEPGAAVLVMRGDSIIYDRGFGIADMETGKPITGDTMFNIASVSKQFSAVAAMKLAEEGKLSLGDPVSKYFPQFEAKFFKCITLKNLLSHTSGIPDARPRDDFDFITTATDEESYYYMKYLDHLNFDPGTRYEYINPTFQLFYTIVPRCSGIPFEKYMKEKIFVPASMPRAVYFEAGKRIEDAAHGYRYDSSAGWRKFEYGEEPFFATKADGGIYTSTREFVNWEKALRKCTVITAEDRDEMQDEKIMISDMPFTGYGYGWFIERKPGYPKKVFHTGNNGGFQIFAGMFPDCGILYLIFANRDDWDREAVVSEFDTLMEEAGWLSR
ncbi:MAG: beta-lactamase family protein [Bacteroidales bacterium]|jgi:CubicO group peptidase (beta-lactamase class C family)|nr:beta-lactamase family protein [Bacteroidales bacterium]MCI2122062.1 beta-lactamase family protein [Bacteroidales bacterium]MCI2146197.1 beta-lactamase family protein [Bacteroidales bacterium]